MYADVDVWLDALTGEGSTEALLEEYGDELAISQATILQLFLLAEDYEFDLERALTAILTVADYDGDESVLYRAAAYHEEGLDAFQAFVAAEGGPRVVSGDEAYDEVRVQRLWLE